MKLCLVCHSHCMLELIILTPVTWQPFLQRLSHPCSHAVSISAFIPPLAVSTRLPRCHCWASHYSLFFATRFRSLSSLLFRYFTSSPGLISPAFSHKSHRHFNALVDWGPHSVPLLGRFLGGVSLNSHWIVLFPSFYTKRFDRRKKWGYEQCASQ